MAFATPGYHDAGPCVDGGSGRRGHLSELAGDPHRAVGHYRAAARRTTSLLEQRYLTARAVRLA